MSLTEEGLLKVPGMLSRWVRLPSGVKAHYMTSGETGPAVVLLHGGVTGSGAVAGWRFMAPFLGANGFRVYCPDLPAFGLTTGPLDFYSPGFPGTVDFLHDFTTALCLDQFHLGGNSMGCSAGLMYLVAHPERVTSVAMIAGNIGDLLHVQDMEAVDPRPAEKLPALRSFDGTRESMRRMMGAVVGGSGALDEDLIEMRTRCAVANQENYARHVEAALQEYRGELDPNTAARLRMRGRLDTLVTPAIYVYGQDDAVNSVEAGYLQEDLLPNVQFFYPADTGHQAQTDSPELINQLFQEFFTDGTVRTSTAKAAGISERRPVTLTLTDG